MAPFQYDRGTETLRAIETLTPAFQFGGGRGQRIGADTLRYTLQHKDLGGQRFSVSKFHYAHAHARETLT
jgi:hypothetical protein